MPFFGFFFSWHRLATQAMSGSYPVELADAHRERKVFGQQVLDLGA